MMKQGVKNSANGANRLVSRLAAEKKKTVTVLCLIAVMVIMWAKVLSRKAPASAAAALRKENVKSVEPNLELNISFVDLPKVEGRNDVLTRDFFVVDDWQDFIKSGEGQKLNRVDEVNVVSKNNKEVMKRVAEKLKLEAIGLDGNPQAFINSKLLSVGDKLFVRDGGNTYECEVVGIEENMVVIKCGEAEISLKLAKIIEVGH